MLVSGLKKCSGAQADKHARTIVELLERVCSRHHLTPDSVQQHLKLLAQMQTAFHLSGLFCPILDRDDDSKKTQGGCICLARLEAQAPCSAQRLAACLESVHMAGCVVSQSTLEHLAAAAMFGHMSMASNSLPLLPGMGYEPHRQICWCAASCLDLAC